MTHAPVHGAEAVGEEPGTERISAFSDGVFAVAITLLILDIGVSANTKRLPEDLVSLWPAYLAYAMSFGSIGIIWAQHHTLFTLIKRSDHVFLLINILFLMWLCFVPFPTRVLAQQLGKHNEQAAMIFYAGWFLVGTIPFNALWFYAAGGRRLLGDAANPHLVRVVSRSYALGPVFYVINVGLSLMNAIAGLVFFILLAVFYAVAPIPVVARSRFMRPITGL